MTDIVEQIRYLVLGSPSGPELETEDSSALFLEAAAEIEQLRRLLKEASCYVEAAGCDEDSETQTLSNELLDRIDQMLKCGL